MLESNLHKDNAFLTLTYRDQTLPMNSNSLPVLIPKDLQDWLKRFRKAIQPLKVRYYAVGEYGDQTQRPHYHVALFGYPPCNYGLSRYSTNRQNCCTYCDTVRDTWSLGNIVLGTLTTNSAQYVAGYVTKKMNTPDDYRLNGRTPEFARMSLRPGIGSDFMHEVASTMLTHDLDQTEDDVPSALRHGSRTLPLGRYLKKQLRKAIGKDEKTPQVVLDKLKEEMQPLYDAAFNNSQNLKTEVVNSNKQRVLQIEGKQKIYKDKRSI